MRTKHHSLNFTDRKASSGIYPSAVYRMMVKLTLWIFA